MKADSMNEEEFATALLSAMKNPAVNHWILIETIS